MDMFLIIPNLSHALAATLDLLSLEVIVYDRVIVYPSWQQNP